MSRTVLASTLLARRVALELARGTVGAVGVDASFARGTDVAAVVAAVAARWRRAYAARHAGSDRRRASSRRIRA